MAAIGNDTDDDADQYILPQHYSNVQRALKFYVEQVGIISFKNAHREELNAPHRWRWCVQRDVQSQTDKIHAEQS